MQAQFEEVPITDVKYDDAQKEAEAEEEEETQGPSFSKRFTILVKRRIRETIRHQECVHPPLPPDIAPYPGMSLVHEACAADTVSLQLIYQVAP